MLNHIWHMYAKAYYLVCKCGKKFCLKMLRQTTLIYKELICKTLQTRNFNLIFSKNGSFIGENLLNSEFIKCYYLKIATHVNNLFYKVPKQILLHKYMKPGAATNTESTEQFTCMTLRQKLVRGKQKV